MYSFGEKIFKWMAFFAVSLPIIIYFFANGTITIEKPYQEEFKLCEQQLVDCYVAKTPQCAPVDVDCGSTGIVFAIIGCVMYLLSIIHFVYGDEVRKIIKKKVKKK